MEVEKQSGVLSALQRVKRMFHMDLRSLALARVFLAIALLFDLEQKFRFIDVFYSDGGLLRRSDLANFLNQPYFFSLHMASGEVWFQVVLFAISALLAIFLLFGYKTKTVAVLSWIMLLSLQSRNLVILNAGDGILRLLLFWGMFLPLGAMWSLDHALSPEEEKPKEMTLFSAGTVAWVTQIVFIYWVTVYLRQSPEWFSEGSALYYSLNIDQLTTEFGYWLSLQPLVLLQVLTWCSVAIEAGAPLLTLIPDKRGIARTLGVLLGVTFHFGIFLMMHIGVFPFISMIGWLAMLPTGFWETAKKWFSFGRDGTGLKMYYDENCGFCLKTVQILRTFLGLSKSKVLPAQSADAIEEIMHKENSWVVERTNGERSTRWQGIIAVTKASPLFFLFAPILSLKPISFLGNIVYSWVANHRVLMGNLTKFFQWRSPAKPLGILGTIFACFALFLTLGWNLQVMKFVDTLPEPLQNATLLLRLDQYWNMFAPFPLRDDGWYVIPGQLINGKEMNLVTNTAEVSFEKPARLSETFPTESWRKFFLNLWMKDYEKYREFYSDYHCNRWNKTHSGDERLKTLQIYFMKETTPKPALRGQEQVQKIQIWEWKCGGIEG